MVGNVTMEWGKEGELEFKKVLFLYSEKEYAEALAEHLIFRFDWSILLCDVLEEEGEQADLILAEEGWFEVLRNQEELWRKTVFLLEQPPCEEPMTRNVFPYLLWKYDGFSKIRSRIAEAMDKLAGGKTSGWKEELPIILMGAWDGKESQSWELACELADQIKRNVLHVNFEKFAEEYEDISKRRENLLDNLLYYVLDRLEIEGCDSIETIRGLIDIREGVCSLPEFCGYNPLLRLNEEQWDKLLPMLCEASCAAALFLWTGREELTHCSHFRGKRTHCLYVVPMNLSGEEERRWEQMRAWMKTEGETMIRTKVYLADSWAKALELVVNHGHELD